MKPGSNRDQPCYPFIYETSCRCDFEVATDELCGHIGALPTKPLSISKRHG